MPTVKIEIDMDSGVVKEERRHILPVTIGLLSSIELSDDLKAAFKRGFGRDPDAIKQDVGYKPNAIIAAKNSLVTQGVNYFAAAGGTSVFQALTSPMVGTTPPFVCLMGKKLTTGVQGNCQGWISLDSAGSNTERRRYLKNLPGGHYNDANIYLLTNNNSKTHADEDHDWGNAGTFRVSYVGDGTGGHDETKFDQDFHGAVGHPPRVPNAAVSALVISDDPFFQEKRYRIIDLVNAWVTAAGTNRRAVYPSDIYGSAKRPNGTTATPAAGRSTLYGPPLVGAYEQLGSMTLDLVNGQKPGFRILPWDPPHDL